MCCAEVPGEVVQVYGESHFSADHTAFRVDRHGDVVWLGFDETLAKVDEGAATGVAGGPCGPGGAPLSPSAPEGLGLPVLAGV